MKCQVGRCQGKVEIEYTHSFESTDGYVILTKWRCVLNKSHQWDTSTLGTYLQESG